MAWTRKQIGGTICGSVCLVLGIGMLVILGFILPHIIDQKLREGIRDQIIIDSPSSSGFNSWQYANLSDAVPLYQKFYLFNVTNPDEYLTGNAPLKLVQVGPYTYRKIDVKFDISFEDDGNLARFKTYTYFLYEKDLSVGNPWTDTVTVINVPVQAVHGVVGFNWWQSLAFDMLASASKSEYFTTRTIHELAWGYNDTLLEMIANLEAAMGGSGNPSFGLAVNATSQENADETTTYDTMYTGKKEISQVATYQSVQNVTLMKYWGSEEANTVRGSDGTKFGPNIKESDNLVVWVDNAMRSADLTCQSKVKIYGINLNRFQLNPKAMENASLVPENAAYYSFGPSGVLNLTSVQGGAPVFLSKPHFLGADPFYLSPENHLSGLHPDEQLHETYLDVEPITGVVMNAAKRLQVNVLSEHTMLLFPNVKKSLIPLGWIEQSSQITPDLAKKFKNAVYTAEKVKTTSSWVGWIGGSAVITLSIGVITLIAYSRRMEKRRRDKHLLVPLINDTDTETKKVFRD